MGSLIVVTGPPGAGKSTVAALLADRPDLSALVVGDTFFAFLRKGAVAPWLPEADEQNGVVIEAAAAASGRLAGYFDVVYDGVLGPWFLPTFRAHSGLDHLDYAMLLPPLHVCLDRVRTRRNHGFSDLDAAERMWNAFARASIAPRYRFAGALDADDLAGAIADQITAGALRYPV